MDSLGSSYWKTLRPGACLLESGWGAKYLDTHAQHQRGDVAPAHGHGRAVALQVTAQQARTLERELQMRLVNAPHQR